MTPARLEAAAVGIVALLLGGAAAHVARQAPEWALPGASPARVVLGVAAGWAAVAAGLALSTGGARLVGRLLAAAGCAWLAAGLASPGAGLASVFTLGLVATAAAPAFVGHAVLADARTRRRAPDDVVIAALYVCLVGLLGVLPAFFFDPGSEGCSSCPANVLDVADGPGTVGAFFRWGVRLGLAAVIACIARALWRHRRSQRWRAWPLVAPGCVYLALVAADLAHDWRRGFVGSDGVDQALWTAQAIALLAVAAGVALLRAADWRQRARLARLVVQLAEGPRPGALGDALATVLGDSQLELLHVAPDGLIDADGRTRTPAPGTTTTPLVRDGEPVALLCHRPELLDDPQAVLEIERSVRLGLEHERLQALLRRELERLRRSRAEVAAASEAERRQLERDLHDGAQQRLAAFVFAAALARHRVAAPLDARVARAQHEVQQALDELREIAHGLYPVALAEAGLAAAIESLSDRRPALNVEGLPTERFAPPIEETAYFAVATLAEHWAPHPVALSASRCDGHLTLDLSASAGAPGDLLAIDDRVAALDGTLTVDSPPQGATRVSIALPCG